MKKEYLAHSANGVAHEHPLAQHLSAVAQLAGEFLSDCELAAHATAAGLLHDLGKYGDRFQDRLRGQDQGLDHWSAGAWVALSRLRSIAAAAAIQGHHVGLQPIAQLGGLEPKKLVDQHPLGLDPTDPDPDRLLHRFQDDGLELPALALGRQMKLGIASLLDMRLVFSALVDADFLDTEAHFLGDEGGKRYRRPAPALHAEKALAVLLDHLARMEAVTTVPPKVAAVRQALRAHCLAAAERPPGLHTLTAPTGSGKTLAMLAFALAHACAHGLRRIIVVIPYLSIIEQTAAIYRELFEPHFGADFVLEHHSLAGSGSEPEPNESTQSSAEQRRRQLAENWDAPLVVTTNVQLLESMFANRPSRCRKLHRLREAVILFDEAQTLPKELALPTLAVLSHLATAHRGSVLFATATQPAFEHLDDVVRRHVEAGWRPTEIVPEPGQLFAPLRRVRVTWRSPRQAIEWGELAAELAGLAQVLCVVNTKKHARALWEALGDEAEHLSTNLCPAHRQAVLARVRKALAGGGSCRLVSTQCVEAGVDLDFPRVYRAYGPLDALIQVAGRCNRNGRLAWGDMHVFQPVEAGSPGAAYDQATALTRQLVAGSRQPIDLDDPEVIRRYYRQLYDLAGVGEGGSETGILAAGAAGDFPEVARRYRLFKDDTINVVVPYAEASTLYRELVERAEQGIDRAWLTAARPLAVSLHRPPRDDAIWDALMPVVGKSAAARRRDEWFVYLRDEDYHPRLGLCPSGHLKLWLA